VKNFEAMTDPELFSASIVAGIARWEPFSSREDGELCLAGIRHTVYVQDGLPELSGDTRNRVITHLKVRA
jgi:hypothetical protein